MNEFARDHSGDDVFRKIMTGTILSGAIFALYMIFY